MQQIIDHIRSKPYHKRNQIIWAIAAVVIILLAVLWIIVGNGRKSEDRNFFQSFSQDLQNSKNSNNP